MKFGPYYSPLSNGLNERNHASADLTISKLMKEKRTPLDDSLVKASSCAHNSSINKLKEFSSECPGQLISIKTLSENENSSFFISCYPEGLKILCCS